MEAKKNCILTINNGSSSIKFSLYQIEEKLVSLFDGEVLNTNTAHPTLHFKNHITDKKNNSNIKLDKDDDGTRFLINWLEKELEVESLKAVVHRIVQGLDHTQPQKIDDVLLVELKTIAKYDSTHFPRSIKIIETIQKYFPALLQIACFDTSFHTSIPQMAKLLPLPRRYYDAGIKRYGFHGISYSYIMKEYTRQLYRPFGEEIDPFGWIAWEENSFVSLKCLNYRWESSSSHFLEDTRYGFILHHDHLDFVLTGNNWADNFQT